MSSLLSQVFLDAEDSSGKAKVNLKKRTPQVPRKVTCVGEKDITKAFRSFLKEAQERIKKSSTLSSGRKAAIINMMQVIVAAEGSVNIQNFKVLSCSKINNPLILFGETAGAEIDAVAKTLRLSDVTWSLAGDFLATDDISFLTEFFQIIAHEKRHVTIGSVVQVSASGLKAGVASTEAAQAQYRVSEILVKAEEIAVGKRMNETYSVPVNLQQLIRKHWTIVEARVNNTELTRLRNLIIEQLRKRYGFKNGCDNVITLGILSSMANGRWHVCSSGSVSGTVPTGLKLCKNKDGTHQVCGIH